MEALLIRPMVASDLDQAMTLKEAANWNQTRDDWEMLLGLPGAQLIAERDGSIVGTIAALDYDDFVWVAMVLVHPNNRRQGIASQLMEKVLELFPGRILRLDATADGSKVYERFHFREEYRLSRWRFRPENKPGFEPSQIVGLVEDPIPEILRKDLSVFGGNRAELLKGLSICMAPLTDQQSAANQLSYLFYRPGINAWQIGPVVSLQIDGAVRLIKKCLAKVPDQDFFIDIPEKEEWMATIRQLRFKKERVFIRMQYGGWKRASSPEEFAIAGPEFG